MHACNKNTPPQPKTTMNILYSTYQRLVASKEYPGQPVHEVLTKILYKLDKLTEDNEEIREFLQMAINDKKAFREENEGLRLRTKSLEDRIMMLENDMKQMKSALSFIPVISMHACRF